jgi:hypothetical protein
MSNLDRAIKTPTGTRTASTALRSLIDLLTSCIAEYPAEAGMAFRTFRDGSQARSFEDMGDIHRDNWRKF